MNKTAARLLVADVPVWIQRLFWQLLVLALCGVPLLVSHQTENTLWRPRLNPHTFILNTGKIELLLVDAALIAVIVCMVGLAITSRDWRRDFAQSTRQAITQIGGIWWVLLAGWAFLSVLWSVEPQLTLYRSGHIGLALVMALAMAHAVRQGYGKWMLAALILVAGFQSGLAIAQYINDAPLGLTWLDELQTPPNSPMDFESSRLRAYGLTLHPNILAGFLMIAVILSVLVARSSPWYIALPVVLVGLMAVLAIVATSSRLVLVITLAAIFLALPLLLVSRRRIGLVGVGGCCCNRCGRLCAATVFPEYLDTL